MDEELYIAVVEPGTISAKQAEEVATFISQIGGQNHTSKRYRQRRLYLWLRDPRCSRCGNPTVLFVVIPRPGRPGNGPPNMATLDHDPPRRIRIGKHQTATAGTRLMCRRCNTSRVTEATTCDPK